MPYNTFSPSKGPSIGTSHTNKIRTITNEFGDGYAQEIADGLNTHQQEVSLQWNYLLGTVAASIENFFVAQNGTPFFYTLPGEQAAKTWRCVEWTNSYQELGGRSISATFKRVFA